MLICKNKSENRVQEGRVWGKMRYEEIEYNTKMCKNGTHLNHFVRFSLYKWILLRYYCVICVIM